MDKVILVIITFITSTYCLAQTNTYFNYDISAPKDKFNFSSTPPNLPTKDSLIIMSPERGGVAGFTITQQLKEDTPLHLELGAYFEFLGVNLKYKPNSYGIAEDNVFSFEQKQLLFPFRIMAREHIFKERIMVSAHIGASYVIDWCGKYTLNTNPEENATNLTTVEAISFNEQYSLLGWGIGMDIRLFNDDFFLGFRYRQNYNAREILNIDVKTENSKFNITSRGNFNTFAVSITYRISCFWNKQ